MKTWDKDADKRIIFHRDEAVKHGPVDFAVRERFYEVSVERIWLQYGIESNRTIVTHLMKGIIKYTR